MYRIVKSFEFSASHSVRFGGWDEPMHGHNWKVSVYCESRSLDADGMVVNFLDIEHDVRDFLDHSCLNDILPFNPTTENLAEWICKKIPHCYKVVVRECEGNVAEYEADR